LSRLGFKQNADLVKGLYADKKRKEAAAAVSDEMLDALVIAGDADFCRRRLGEWRAAGVGLPILNLPTDLGPDLCKTYLDIMRPAT
jgi:hypothetical protein